MRLRIAFKGGSFSLGSVNESERQQVDYWKKSRLRGLSPAELENRKLLSNPSMPVHMAASELLSEMEEKNLRELVDATKGPTEWKTWTFWMAFAGILIGLAGLAVAILALRLGSPVGGLSSPQSAPPPPAGRR